MGRRRPGVLVTGMLPISALPKNVAQSVRVVFTDIDDTLTTHGKLPAVAYAALWRLHAAGIAVVPVTGRPAGWCDLVARQWPVAGVVGENGALAFYEVAGRLQRMLHPSVAAEATRAKLHEVERAVLAEIPGARVSKDQPYRQFDLAIDFREEPPDLGFDAAEKIRAVFERHGAHAKVSSIHVNGWFGDYDKLAMVKLFARAHLGLDVEAAPEQALFVGDSPNDEPMFGFFPHACAVANITAMAHLLKATPRYVTPSAGGEGFAEVVETLLLARG